MFKALFFGGYVISSPSIAPSQGSLRPNKARIAKLAFWLFHF